MPVHDWTRVDDALFHNFELGWLVELSRRLNHGLLPSTHFALTETIDQQPSPGFPEMPEPESSPSDRGFAGDLHDQADDLPVVRWTFTCGYVEYASRVVTVRDSDCHQVRAAIFIVSPQDKRTRARLDGFAKRVAAALSHDIHVLVVDLLAPGRLDPSGIHPAIWDNVQPTPFTLPEDKPLTLAAYVAGRTRTAYVELVGIGDALPDMPLFLSPNEYVLCPLEETYRASWAVFPADLKELLEPSPAP